MSDDLTTTAHTAAEALRQGRLVAVPTDTQYALSALASHGGAVMHCYALKQRPDSEPMPILLPSADALDTVATNVSDGVRALARAAWPGALTLVLPRRMQWHSLAATGDTVAVRVPDHPLALAILDDLGEPITGSSANQHGKPAARTAEDVERAFGDEVLALPPLGVLPGGAASTILDCTDGAPRIVREGAVPGAEVERLVAAHLAT